MLQEQFASRLYRRLCCCVIFFVAASASFNGYFDKWHFREPGVVLGESNDASGRFGFAEMMDGTAARPYVYRQLLPAIVNWLDRIAPESFKNRLYSFHMNQGRMIDVMFDSPIARNPLYLFRYMLLHAIVFVFAWLSVYAMYLVCRALEFPILACVFAPVIMILAIPYFMTVGGYFWDYPELAFLALAVWMGLKFNWWWMLPLVALGAWNKESFVFVVLSLYPILRSRHSRISTSIGTALLFLTCSAVYLMMRSRFSGNSGASVLVEWIYQVVFFLRPINLIDVEKTYGIMTFRAFTLLPAILIIWTVRRGWSRLPLAIRRHGKIAVMINFPLFFLFCAPGELRDLSMLYIVFMLLLAANIAAESKDISSVTEVVRTSADPLLKDGI